MSTTRSEKRRRQKAKDFYARKQETLARIAAERAARTFVGESEKPTGTPKDIGRIAVKECSPFLPEAGSVLKDTSRVVQLLEVHLGELASKDYGALALTKIVSLNIWDLLRKLQRIGKEQGDE